jgi:hypothetical protein
VTVIELHGRAVDGQVHPQQLQGECGETSSPDPGD